MAGQTYRVSSAGIQTIRMKMKLGQWTQSQVVQEVGFSRATLNQILSEQSVRLENIEELCHLFELEIGQIIEKKQVLPSREREKLTHSLNLVRQQVSQQIKLRCGVMRVLDMTQPIDSTAIYTDVNILERVVSKTRADLEKLMMGMTSENFDRFCLGEVRQERVAGLRALERHQLLMILGKPGAGKTTFLKRLAMWSKEGKQELKSQVPIFVTLKEFSDNYRKQKSLLDFIKESYNLKALESELESLLQAGKVLVLLDGLDEVQQDDAHHLISEIRDFSRKYKNNRIVVTCRIAAKEYVFEQFTEVEIADFQDDQIRVFANKWFTTHFPDQVYENGESTIGSLFWKELEQNQPVKELATNPLLLTLLCLEFGEDCCFPSSRSELYARGLDILFTKWDGTRQIKREIVYKKLPVARKKHYFHF